MEFFGEDKALLFTTGEVLINVENKKTGNILKAGRKLLGFNQIELASTLGVSQSNISKLENGLLAPTLQEWVNFCDLLSIDNHFTYKSGVIEAPVKKNSSFYNQESGFKCNKNFLNNQFLKMREILPIVDFLGEKGWKEFCSGKIDPHASFVLNAPVSMELLLDLILWTKNTRGVDPSDILKKGNPEPRLHGSLAVEYSKKKSFVNLLESYIKNMNHYESVFNYKGEMDGEEFKLSFSLPDSIKELASEKPERSSLESYVGYKAARVVSLLKEFSKQKVNSKVERDKSNLECSVTLAV